ncbi:MAG TPA: ankyrin repeat domain-containing protein, partial [Bryobacteraceae bacterium]|nr:ankyrin repeat domain-containing protein [Bryobacteraceae bacterium]
MASVLTREESKELLALCRAGRLYEIEDWIKAGKSIQMAEGVRGTPLQIAVVKGFRSLIELLVRNESQVKLKNKALAWAIEHRRMDLAQLLVRERAEIASLPFYEVLRTWDPKIIRFFLDRGADVIRDQPFADEVRTALRIFKECREKHPELAGQLTQQAESALRFFSHTGNLKWVELMLGLGADPRSKGPMVYSDHDGDHAECYVTGVEEACSLGKLDVLQRFKVRPETDDLPELLRSASLFAHVDVIRYLLDLGVQPNELENGGSSALERCIWHLEYEDLGNFPHKELYCLWRNSRTWEAITVLAKAGAVWRPDGTWTIGFVRRKLLKVSPALVTDVFELLKGLGACTEETVRLFLDNPPMRKHLAGRERDLARFGLKCPEARPAPTASNQTRPPVQSQPPPR